MTQPPQENKGIEEWDWKLEFREYFDKVLKPKKPTMQNLDREICVDFIEKVSDFNLHSYQEELVEKIGELKKKVPHLADDECDYNGALSQVEQIIKGK